MRPIQPKVRVSNLAFSVSSICASTVSLCGSRMVEPSRGRRLAKVLAATRPLAPGMFWTMMVGLPGMYCEMCFATSRA